MHKINSKKLFIQNKINTPKFFSISRYNFNKKIIKKTLNNKRIKFPIVSKPINEGSSLGVEICKDLEELFKSIKRLLKKYKELLIEEYIGGQEVQVAVINGKLSELLSLFRKGYFMIIRLNILKAQKQNILCQQDYQEKIQRGFNFSTKSS